LLRPDVAATTRGVELFEMYLLIVAGATIRAAGLAATPSA
jgi:hypothetical protein